LHLSLQTQTTGTTRHGTRRRLAHASFIGRGTVKTIKGLTEQLPGRNLTNTKHKIQQKIRLRTSFVSWK
jgi:hypothetical protein